MNFFTQDSTKSGKNLFTVYDFIGCMSPANVDYAISNNHEVSVENVEVCPNSMEIEDKSVDEETRIAIRNKYGIPIDKTVLVYGGNFGWWCQSDNANKFFDCLLSIKENDLKVLGNNAFDYLKNNYDVEIAADIVLKRINC